MADVIIKEQISETFTPTLVGGEVLEIRVLNSDLTEKTVIYSASIPSGKTLIAAIAVGGQISSI